MRFSKQLNAINEHFHETLCVETHLSAQHGLGKSQINKTKLNFTFPYFPVLLHLTIMMLQWVSISFRLRIFLSPFKPNAITQILHSWTNTKNSIHWRKTRDGYFRCLQEQNPRVNWAYNFIWMDSASSLANCCNWGQSGIFSQVTLDGEPDGFVDFQLSLTKSGLAHLPEPPGTVCSAINSLCLWHTEVWTTGRLKVKMALPCHGGWSRGSL